MFAAVFDAQQVNVVRHGDRGERAFDVQAVDGSGELVIRRTHIGAVRGILAAGRVQQLGRPSAVGENNVGEERLRGIRDVRHFVQRQPELVMRERSADDQIAGTYAHDVGESVAGEQDESGQDSHVRSAGGG